MIKLLEPLVRKITDNDQDDPNIDVASIKILNDRFASTKNGLLTVQKQLSSQLLSKISQLKNREFPPVMPGGILNGGNTCYLATGLQVMRVIPTYRQAMNPELNPLKQHEREDQFNFEQRKLVQQKGHQILQKLTAGESITFYEINAFRKICHECQATGRVRVVSSLFHQEDATEVLMRILDILDCNSKPLQCIERRIMLDDAPKIIPGEIADFTSIEELKRGVTRTYGPSIQLPIGPHLGPSVPLQRLIDELWADEFISDVMAVDQDENGVACLKEFKSTRLEKKVIIEAELPEFIPILVKQSVEMKTIVTETEEIYPFGTENGPKYRLQAIIEHRYNHYVAHTRQENGEFIEANDGWVYDSPQIIAGFDYYYLKSEK